MYETPIVTIHTDGSYRPVTDMGGWCGLLQCGERWQIVYGNHEHCSISRMELNAVVKCLEQLLVPCRVIIYSDSMYVVNGICQWLQSWAVNGWRTSSRRNVEHADLWQRIHELMSTHQVTAYHVKAHNGHEENELCDFLAYYSSGVPV